VRIKDEELCAKFLVHTKNCCLQLGGVVEVVEHPTSKCKALSPNPSTAWQYFSKGDLVI
jgi:hypothetical protein